MAMDQVSTFAQRLKEALGDTTLTEFAKKIGLSKQAISNYTTGVSLPKRPVIASIATTLNVSEAWLCGYDVPKERIYNKPSADEPKQNQVIAIARGGEKVQYDLTEAELQAVLTLLDSIKKR